MRTVCAYSLYFIPSRFERLKCAYEIEDDIVFKNVCISCDIGYKWNVHMIRTVFRMGMQFPATASYTWIKKKPGRFLSPLQWKRAVQWKTLILLLFHYSRRYKKISFQSKLAAEKKHDRNEIHWLKASEKQSVVQFHRCVFFSFFFSISSSLLRNKMKIQKNNLDEKRNSDNK